MAEEALRTLIIDASRRSALEGRSHRTPASQVPLIPLVGGLLVGALLLSRRRPFVRTAIAIGACGFLGAMVISQRARGWSRGNTRSDDVPTTEPADETGIDAASSMSFPASDPPASSPEAAVNSVEFSD